MFSPTHRLVAAISFNGVGRGKIAGTAPTIAPISSRRGLVRKRGINSNSRQQRSVRTNEKSSLLFLYKNGINFMTRRTKVTTLERRNVFQQQGKNRIPQPTWSIQDLALTTSHPPISQKELERLARLVLIDVSGNINNYNGDNLDSLKQDLGNMLHMIQHVTEYEHQQSTGNATIDTRNNRGDDSDDAMCGARIYDTVRGVKAIPLRKGIEEDPFQAEDAVQAQEIWEHFLQPKMIRRGGGHVYFAIETTAK